MISHDQISVTQTTSGLIPACPPWTITTHSGIRKMIQETRPKNYYPCIAKYIRTWVTRYQMCIQNTRIKIDHLKTELINCPEWDLGPENILQIFFRISPKAEVMATLSQTQQ